MNQDDLIAYQEKLSSLTEEEKKQRDLYLKRIGSRPDVSQYTDDELQHKMNVAIDNIPEGKMVQGPTIGYPEFDKTFLQYYSDEAIKQDIPNMTITDFVWECNKDNMDGLFAKYFNEKITYKEFKEKVNEAKSALIASGIKPYNGLGQRKSIGIALPTMPETFYLFFAAIDLGCIATMIDPRINEERIKDCIIDANCSLVFNIDKFNEKFGKIADELNMNDKFVPVSGAQSLPGYMKFFYNIKAKVKKNSKQISYNDFLVKGKSIDSSNVFGKFDPDAPAALEFTSGTTNRPKGAYLSNKNLVGVALQEQNAFTGKETGDEFLNIMPPFITYGLACGMCSTLCEKLCLRLIPNFEPKNFAKLILKYKPQHVIGVPSFFEQLANDKSLENKDLSFLKYCIAGGDKLSPVVEEKINGFFKKHGIKNNIIKGYGMTELSSVAAVNLDNDSNKIGSTGIPFPKNNIKVLNPETGEKVGTNEYGEIYESGPTQMLGYLNHPELEKELFIQDETGTTWVKTGDRGKIDEDGQIFIDGRYKNTIVRPDGHNVYPNAIENIIASHPGIESCVVIGVKSKEYESGEIPTACIVLNEQYIENSAEIIEQINQLSLEKLPPRDIALAYEIVDKIPTTSVGKIDINGLKQLIEERQEIKRVR